MREAKKDYVWKSSLHTRYELCESHKPNPHTHILARTFNVLTADTKRGVSSPLFLRFRDYRALRFWIDGFIHVQSLRESDNALPKCFSVYIYIYIYAHLCPAKLYRMARDVWCWNIRALSWCLAAKLFCTYNYVYIYTLSWPARRREVMLISSQCHICYRIAKGLVDKSAHVMLKCQLREWRCREAMGKLLPEYSFWRILRKTL